MCGISRSVLRWGLLAGLGLGGLTLLIGPHRVGAAFDQLRSTAGSFVDSCVDDPIALRRQLQSLADQYPDRLAQIQGEIAEVERQIELLQQDTEVSKRVISMTGDDLTALKTLITRAEDKARTGVPVAIRTGGVRYDLKGAHTEAVRIASLRATYQDRAASNEQQLQFLTQQHSRLKEILGRIETEYSDFETKLVQLDRQIDAIERNDRLIDMTREQQAILADYEKLGKVGNLTQLEGKLAELRRVQEAQLETLSKSGVNRDYERRARQQLLEQDSTLEVEAEPAATDVPVVEIEEPQGDSSVAWAEPVIITP